LASLSIEPLAFAEVLGQAWTDQQPIGRIDAKIAAVEEGMDVGPEQQPIVQPMLARPLCDRPDVGSLLDRPNHRTRDGAAPMVCIEHLGLESLLSKGRAAAPSAPPTMFDSDVASAAATVDLQAW
jgi:hypothetical protein